MEPIYEQIMTQIKAEVIEGTLTAGDALPSVRALSRELKISALTVKKAYDGLEAAGFVTTIHGKGTYVTAADRQLAMEARRKTVEDEFQKIIDRAEAMGLDREEILEIVQKLIERG